MRIRDSGMGITQVRRHYGGVGGEEKMPEGENKGDKEGTGEGISESDAEDGQGTRGGAASRRRGYMRPVGRDQTKQGEKRREQVELVWLQSEGTANYHILREQNSKQRGQPKAGEQKAEVREERRRGCGFF